MFLSLLFAAPFGIVHTLLLNHPCFDHSQCSVLDSMCTREYKYCRTGHCKCKEGYRNDGNTECNKIQDINELCSAYGDICIGGALCTGVPEVCKCPAGTSFNYVVQMCIDDSQKLLGGVCSDVTGCYTSYSVAESVECSPMPGATSPSYCKCKEGFIQTNYACRLPDFGETCTKTVGCKHTTSTDQSVSQLSCTDSLVCLCDPEAEARISALSGSPNWLCMAKFDGDLIANGYECATSRECQHKTCVACPGETTSICVTGKTSGTDVSKSSLIFTATMVVLVSVVVSL